MVSSRSMGKGLFDEFAALFRELFQGIIHDISVFQFEGNGVLGAGYSRTSSAERSEVAATPVPYFPTVGLPISVRISGIMGTPAYFCASFSASDVIFGVVCLNAEPEPISA